MTLNDYLLTIDVKENRDVFRRLIDQVKQTFPHLELVIKWNQPMFVDHGTFIISFSHAAKHISVAPEKLIMDKFTDRIKSKYNAKKMIFQIKWNQTIDFDLISDIIQESVDYKLNYNKFWL